MKKPKSLKPLKENHVAPTKYGMGDNYGTGVKAKLGRMRDDSMGMGSLNQKKLKTPPRGLA